MPYLMRTITGHCFGGIRFTREESVLGDNPSSERIEYSALSFLYRKTVIDRILETSNSRATKMNVHGCRLLDQLLSVRLFYGFIS